MHGFFNFQLETSESGVEDFKTMFWTKGATIFRASQVLKDVNYNSGIEFYRRYVHDTFALFNAEQDALTFLSHINSQHPTIKFTLEWEENHKLPFLDVLLDNPA